MTNSDREDNGSRYHNPISEWRRFRDLSRENRVADEAVRRQACGKTAAEIRELLVAEIRGRGLHLPPEPLLKVRVDAIMDRQDPVTRARYSARGFSTLLKTAGDAIRDLTSSFEDFTPQPSGGRGLRLVREDRSRPPVEVRLDSGAERWFTPEDHQQSQESSYSGDIHIWLDTQGAGPGDNLTTVNVRANRVGVLDARDARRYAQVLAAARQKNEVAVIVGIRGYAAGDVWHLHIYLPEGLPE